MTAFPFVPKTQRKMTHNIRELRSVADSGNFVDSPPRKANGCSSEVESRKGAQFGLQMLRPNADCVQEAPLGHVYVQVQSADCKWEIPNIYIYIW